MSETPPAGGRDHSQQSEAELPPGIPGHPSEGGRGGPAVPAPDPTRRLPEIVLLAARHLDETEGRVQVGRRLDPTDRAAIDCVLGYLARIHNGEEAS
jgi:hypothetical protein